MAYHIIHPFSFPCALENTQTEKQIEVVDNFFIFFFVGGQESKLKYEGGCVCVCSRGHRHFSGDHNPVEDVGCSVTVINAWTHTLIDTRSLPTSLTNWHMRV